MYSMMRTKAKILVVLLAAASLTTLFFLSPTVSYPPPAAAQEPDQPFSEEALKAFGLTLPPIQATSGPFDLGISKTASTSSVISGGRITFAISITNYGPNEADNVLFYDNVPAQMQDVQYSSDSTMDSNGLTNPTWLFEDPIPNGDTVSIIITGILTSAPDITVTNTAYVSAWDATGETNAGNNSDDAKVGIEGYSPVVYTYLPIIFKSPPPTTELVYHEDFNSGDPWVEFTDWNGCTARNTGGKYQVDLKRTDRTCLPPADGDSYRTYGEFEVDAYHSEDLTGSGSLSNAAYGLFINGNGGSIYYAFIIWPNNSCNDTQGGGWTLIRRNGGSEQTFRSESCNTAINRGGAHNILKIAHKSDGTLILYVNGKEIDSVVDSNQLNSGKTTGVYIRSDDEDVRIKFDNFNVYKFIN